LAWHVETFRSFEETAIEKFQENLAGNAIDTPSIVIPERLHVLARNLIKDAMVFAELFKSAISQGGMMFRDDNLKLTLTRKGKRFIKNVSVPVVAMKA